MRNTIYNQGKGEAGSNKHYDQIAEIQREKTARVDDVEVNTR